MTTGKRWSSLYKKKERKKNKPPISNKIIC